MQSLPLSVPVLAASLFAGGCTTSHRFVVDAVRLDTTLAPAVSFRLVQGGPSPLEPEEAALFARVASDVRTALSSKGMFEAPAGVRCEMEVEVDLGMGAPVQVVRTHTEPVFVMPAAPPGAAMRGGAMAVPSAVTPRKVGDRTVTRTVVEHPKFLHLTARAVDPATDVTSPVPLWSVVVLNQDESDNLARHARLMAAAAMDLLGRDTGGGRVVVLTDSDGRVRFFERGL